MPSPPRVARTAPKPAEQKLTINLGCIDLGQIDLLVHEGFYANRSDFIRTAIRNQLTRHAAVVEQAATRKSLVLGIQRFGVAQLAALVQAGERLQVRVLGLATIDNDVSPELALAAIESVVVLGALQASPAVKAALASRIH